jgi:hypothetical protein
MKLQTLWRDVAKRMVDHGGRGFKKTPKFSTPMERDGHRQLLQAFRL